MSEQARAWVTLIPTAKGFASKVQGEIGPEVQKAGKHAGGQYEKGASAGIGKVKAALAGAFIGGAAVSVLKGFVADARESARIGKLTAQVIKTTGGAANVTAGQVGDLATAISNKTGVDDEAIQSASNLLLTFTNVRNEAGKGNDIFNQTTQAAVDMAAVLGGDASSQSIALGKALNDPIKGMTALSRSGVSFTEDQKKQVKAMVASGDVLGAQKVILGELGKEFGGAAAAASDPSQRLAVTMGNLKETIGTALLPMIDKAATFLNDKVIPALSTAAKFVKDNSTAFKILATVVGTIVAAFVIYAQTVKVITAVTKVWAAVQAVLNGTLALNPIGLVVIAIVALAAGLIYAYKHSETFRRIVTGAFDAVRTAVTAVFNWVKGNWPLLLGILTGPFGLLIVGLVRYRTQIVGAVTGAFDAVKRVISGVFNWVKGNWPLLLGILTGPFGLAIALIVRYRDQIVGAIKHMKDLIAHAASGMWDGIKSAFRGAVNFIIDAWNGLQFKIPGFDPPGPGPKFGGFTLGVPDIPRLATGGPVVAGRPYVVGEYEPELFVPRQDGSVLNQRQILAATAAGGGGAREVHHHEWTINNPVPETAPQSAANNLRRLGFVLGAA